MKRYLPLLLLCPLTFLANGQKQNLVPNPGFEEKTKTPEHYGEWNGAGDWKNGSDNGSIDYPYGSPDYLVRGADLSVGIPVNTFGYVEAHTGNAIMGLVGFHNGGEEFREYLSCRLKSPMKVGAKYKVSFWITNGEKDRYGDAGCNHMGLKLSVNPLKQNEHEALAVKPTFEIEEVLFTTQWKQFTYEFTADSAYVNFVFGNLYHDSQTTKELKGEDSTSSYKGSAYYFVDDFSITCEQEPETNNDPVTVAPTVPVIYIKPPTALAMDEFGNEVLPYEIEATQPDSALATTILPAENHTLILINPYPNEELTVVTEDTTMQAPQNTTLEVNNSTVVSEPFEVTVYPNPANAYFFISCNEMYSYYIYSSSAQLISSGVKNNGAIDVSQLAVGGYIVKIISEKAIVTRRLQVVR